MKDAAPHADPATFEIVKNSLYKIAEEMRVVLAKTAYSPLLKSAGDYSCGVFDAKGEMVAQGPDLPIHLGSMPDAVRAVVAAFGADVHDGDVFIHNDPYFGGSHLPDVNVVRPAFHDGRLLGYTCLRAHWPDVGSATPGSYGAVTEIYGEGLRLPPLRLVSRGVPNVDLEKVILANVRTPDERKGDLGAQLAATLRATERLKALAERYGAERLVAYMAEVMDYSERLMRAALADLPDGEGAFEDFCDGDGIPDDADGKDAPFWIRMRVTKTGDRVVVDFAGTDPRVKGPINAPLSVTASGVYCGLKMAVDPDSLIPPNSGCWRTIEVKAPKGSVVNAEFPAPVVYANHEISHRVADMVMGALAGLLAHPRDGLQPGHLGDPHARRRRSALGTALRVLRDHEGRLRRAPHQGRHQRRRQRHLQHHEHAGGGLGDGLPRARGALRDQPGLRRRRQVSRRLRLPPRVAHAGGRRRHRRAVHGAHDLAAVRAARRQGRRGRRRHADDAGWRHAAHLPSKGAFNAPAGSIVDMITPGSGGFGPVSERDPAAIGRDLLGGYVSEKAAQHDYGITDPQALRAKAAKDQA